MVERDDTLIAAALRRKRLESEAFVSMLAAAHTSGADVDWTPLTEGGRRVELPTYPFERERYWLTSTAGAGDVAAAGLSATDHPLLGAAVAVAGQDEWLFTGRLSLGTHPWLRDHAVMDTVFVPGTAFAELALAAAQRVGAGDVEELTLVTPLVLAGDDSVRLQVTVPEPDEDGCRPINVSSRAEADED